MARGSYTTSNYFRDTTAIVSGTPLTFAAWIKKGSTADQYIWNIAGSADTNHYLSLNITSSDTLQIAMKAGPTGQFRNVTSTTTIGTGWTFVAGTAASNAATDMHVWVGSSKEQSVGTDTGTNNMTSPNRTGLGALVRSTVAAAFTGTIEIAGVWNEVLSDAQITSLSGGAPFATIDIGSVVDVWECRGTGSIVSLFGDTPLAQQGTVAEAEGILNGHYGEVVYVNFTPAAAATGFRGLTLLGVGS